MSRVYNFSAGPAVLPEEVLKEAADEMLDYRGTGMSVMEMSHRSKAFETIIKEAEADLRELMNIPDNYKVLFLQGGASQQFAMIPMNLMKNKVADYIVTGQWAKKAWQEASKYGKANKIASSEDETFSYIPDCSDLPISEDADYVYICENNTIYGTKFKTLPNTKGKTLVADVSSCFLSEPVDVSKYGIIYGGVQKNIGPAGVVIVIIREDLITEDVLPGTPTMLTYKTHADADSLYNTPPAYGIYICGKVFKWLKKMGGLEVMKQRNEEKAKILYDFLDESKLFKGTVRKEDRSLMNVPFVTGDKDLDAKFVEEAKKAFAGNELAGKKLGVIGLGAIGVRVANAATHLGMEVYGYDPFISVNAAWNLSRNVKHINSVEEIYSACDFITIHVPLLDDTKKMLNKEAFAQMKDGVVVLNFARDLLVDEEAILTAIEEGKVKKYVTDFPNTITAGKKGCIVTPHLGASTQESEDNCAVMAVKEIKDYLENGNIRNSVNFPNCNMGACTQAGRIAILHKNKKGIIGKFSNILGDGDINITDMTNKSRGDYAYSLLDLESNVTEEIVGQLAALDGVLKVRVIK